MHADITKNEQGSTVSIAFEPPIVLAIFNALSEATGLSGEELDGLDGKASIILNYPKKTGNFTMQMPLPPHIQLPVSDED